MVQVISSVVLCPISITSDPGFVPKKRRNLPGTPDPEAEVIALSPRSLMATNRFMCEVCGKGFQRDQNLQLHRRGHNLPWKLKQRSGNTTRKKVYICPEKSCVHNHPSRALGDLTGVKKHFYRKHGEKKWKCEKCSKGYAVYSDWKAHSKICGTREYKCGCGTIFSRRDSFFTHRAFCEALAEETARLQANFANNTNYDLLVANSLNDPTFVGDTYNRAPDLMSCFSPLSALSTYCSSSMCGCKDKYSSPSFSATCSGRNMCTTAPLQRASQISSTLSAEPVLGSNFGVMGSINDGTAPQRMNNTMLYGYQPFNIPVAIPLNSVSIESDMDNSTTEYSSGSLNLQHEMHPPAKRHRTQDGVTGTWDFLGDGEISL